MRKAILIAAALLALAACKKSIAFEDVLYFTNPENSLVLKIMDRKNRFDIGIERQMGILDFQKCRNHPALPVMRVNHIRLEINERQHIQNTAAEKSEPFILVSAHSVNIRTAEIELVVHEIPCNTVLDKLFDSAVLPAPSQLNLEITNVNHLV